MKNGLGQLVWSYLSTILFSVKRNLPWTEVCTSLYYWSDSSFNMKRTRQQLFIRKHVGISKPRTHGRIAWFDHMSLFSPCSETLITSIVFFRQTHAFNYHRCFSRSPIVLQRNEADAWFFFFVCFCFFFFFRLVLFCLFLFFIPSYQT